MRIIHVIDYFQPQLGYQETFLARAHAEAGHDVYIVTSDRFHPGLYKGNSSPIMGDRIKGEGFFIESSVQVWRLKVSLELPNIVWISGLEKKIREINPDLVIVHNITNFSAVRIAKMKNGGANFKLIFDDHATNANATGKMRFLYPWFRWTLSKSIQKASDGLVAILPETKGFMQKKYGIPGDLITVIPLGADLKLFYYDTTARQEIRKKHRIQTGDTLYVYTGKIIPFRQVTVLVKAFAEVAAKKRNIKLLFVGTGETDYVNELKTEIESLGISDLVRWQNAVPNELMFEYYSAADVSVWPFQASIGMREAMACGLPVIIGEKSMVTELVEDNNGFTFTEGDPDDLSEKMEKLLDAGLRKEMGASSRKLVEERFNWDTIAAQFLDLIR